MTSKTVLVTGSAGFIGGHTVRMLLEKGYRVAGLDIAKMPQSYDGVIGLKHFHCDVTSVEHVRKVVEEVQPEYVIHLAGLTDASESFSKEADYFKANVTGTLNVVQSALELGVKRVVFSSSCAVYGQPESLPVAEDAKIAPVTPYGKQKSVSESAVKGFTAGSVVLRYSNVYGPKDAFGGEPKGVVKTFMHSLSLGLSPKVFGSGLQKRDFVFVKDVALANVVSLTSPEGTFNVGSGKGQDIFGLAQHACTTWGTRFAYQRVPKGAIEIESIYLNIAKAQNVLGWKPSTDLKTGLQSML